MLFTGLPNHFNWQVDNYGATLTDAGIGTLLTSGASHTKGSNTALLAGIANDCYGISIMFTDGETPTTVRRQMTDLLIDPAAGIGNAGSSWTVKIANLYSNSPCLSSGMLGYSYYFPLFLPAGTAIGAAMQDVVGSATVRMSVRLFGQPSRPEAMFFGNQVQTIGATTASTTGVAVTPGATAWGSYSASMGTLDRASWWWQVGIGSDDTTMNSAHNDYYDVACNATNKITCLQEVQYAVVSSNEQAFKMAFSNNLPIKNISAGENVYVRGYSTGADASMTAVVYAVSS
jgi:hypothetical protein